MKVELLYVAGCPHRDEADARIRAALDVVDERDVDVDVRHVLVSSQAEAEALGFLGSPSVHIDGEDPFADHGATVGLTCRLYRTAGGTYGAPTVEQLTRAFRRARSLSRTSNQAYAGIDDT